MRELQASVSRSLQAHREEQRLLREAEEKRAAEERREREKVLREEKEARLAHIKQQQEEALRREKEKEREKEREEALMRERQREWERKEALRREREEEERRKMEKQDELLAFSSANVSAQPHAEADISWANFAMATNDATGHSDLGSAPVVITPERPVEENVRIGDEEWVVIKETPPSPSAPSDSKKKKDEEVMRRVKELQKKKAELQKQKEGKKVGARGKWRPGQISSFKGKV